MPFAGYSDFDDCVSKNRDKARDPEAFCAAIKRKIEGNASFKDAVVLEEEKHLIVDTGEGAAIIPSNIVGVDKKKKKVEYI